MTRQKLLVIILTTCLSVACFALVYPIYVIRPFRFQGPTELAIALIVKRWAPVLAAMAASIAVIAVVVWWQRLRVLLRIPAVAGAVLTAALAALTHINVYELMFHRIDSLETTPANEAKLDADDMVMSINQGNRARAYPIRMMGYHHIANDWVGGIAVVATY